MSVDHRRIPAHRTLRRQPPQAQWQEAGGVWLAEMRFRLWNRFAANLLALVGALVLAAPAGCGDVVAPPSLEKNPMSYINHYNNAGPEEKNRINKASSPAHALYTQNLGPCIQNRGPPSSNPLLFVIDYKLVPQH